MATPLIHLRDIQLRFGHRPLLDGAELAVSARDRLCVVGRNGSGKSTLLKIAAGIADPDDGSRWVQPGTTMRYLPQEPDFSGFENVADYVSAGLGPSDDPYVGESLLQGFGLTGEEDPSRLSGGEARRAALARVLAPEPDILLLDEPTNHLDLPAIEWLEKTLGQLKSALVIISHDRRFLTALSRATLWIDRGQVRRVDSGFGSFEAWRDETLELEALETHKLDRKLEREAHWIRYGVTARRKRNMGRVRRLEDLRAERRERMHNRPTGTATLTVQDAKTSGKLVIEAEGISKTWGEAPIVTDFSCRIARGDKIGIVGPNGAGKTTLINLLTGTLEPDTGTIKLGTALEMATLDQKRDSLKPDATISETLTGGSGDQVIIGGQARHIISYMKDFLFTPEQARTPISALSGGERGRLMLARALARPSNMLVLDEPTNDLDLETLDLLQDMLADYPGTVLLVSHDRDFLDRVATSIIGSEKPGIWQDYAGGYSDMIAQRNATNEGKPEAAAKKSASRYKSRPARAERARLTFKDKHALETLPAIVATLEAEIARLQTALTVPDLYTKDPDGFSAKSKKLEEKVAKRDSAEEEWLRLEILREEAEGETT